MENSLSMANAYIACFLIYKLTAEEISILYNVDINEIKIILQPYQNYEYIVNDKERRMFSVY
jgi:hypothetical protein